MRPPIDAGVILVTGASSGIGRELALQLAPRAKALVLVARRKDRLEELAAELVRVRADLPVVVRPTDLGDLEDTGAMLDEVTRELGPIDVLINNAGFGDIGALDLAQWSKLDQMIRVNVTALTFLTHRVLPAMIERKKGGVMNVSSGFGLTFMPGLSAYVATKHYVSGLTESLRIEVRQHGVVVTQVCPGPVDTEFSDVAGNFTGREPPSLVRTTARACARSAIRGFDRDRALVVPGFWMKLVMWNAALTPRWILRLLYLLPARWMREKQLASGR